MAVPGSITPEAGNVSEDRPNWTKSRVPAQSVVVVGVLISVTFWALAVLAANARRRARQRASKGTGRTLPDIGPELFVVQKLLLIKTFRLSCPEALCLRDNQRELQLQLRLHGDKRAARNSSPGLGMPWGHLTNGAVAPRG